MSSTRNTVIATAAVVAAFAGGSALHAQTTAPSMPQGAGTMMQGQHADMMNMMNMMSQMNTMMENCNKMMERNMGDRPGTQKDHRSPDKQS